MLNSIKRLFVAACRASMTQSHSEASRLWLNDSVTIQPYDAISSHTLTQIKHLLCKQIIYHPKKSAETSPGNFSSSLIPGIVRNVARSLQRDPFFFSSSN